METLKKQFSEHNFIGMYSKECIDFISSNISQGNEKELKKFGESIHEIELNYRTFYASTFFGFKLQDLEFSKYGWLNVQLLDVVRTEINNGNSISVGRGLNNKWSHSTSASYGSAGYGSPLSVFTTDIHDTKKEAEIFALKELLSNHKKYLGDSDTTNYKQDFIKKTINIINQEISKRVNLNFTLSNEPVISGTQMQLF